MLQQDEMLNCAEITFDNPFKSFLQSIDVEQLIDDCIINENSSAKEAWSNIISINKEYKKLHETYHDIKKMAKTYINETEQQSSLESKLNRYIT